MSAFERALDELRRHARGEIFEGAAAVAPFASDFGGMRERAPAAVFKPIDEHEVSLALRVAAEHAIEVTARGTGHSQSGQGLGSGLVIDLTALDRIERVEPDHVVVQAGARWRAVVDATFAQGRLPIGLTHALDMSVGGTLSVAGIGAESFRSGPQVDNVLFMDVALVGGEIVRCSAQENRALFDAVRGGLGQCGLIVRAGYPLRPCGRSIAVRRFAYREADGFVQDIAAVEQAPGSWLSGAVVEAPFARGQFMFMSWIGQERGSERVPPATRLSGVELRGAELPTWTANGNPGHPFFHLFGSDRAAGELNPWVEHLVAPSSGASALRTLIDCGAPALERGRASVIVVRRSSDPAPLFAVPRGDVAIGVGLFATFGTGERERAARTMAHYAARIAPLDGKRFLSGYFPDETSVADWQAHYEDAWPGFVTAKRRYDRHACLRSHLIRWP